MSTRDQIVAALASVPGLSPSPTTPETIVDGSAWPAWVSTTWLNTQGAVRTRWYIFVALTAGDREATALEGDPLVEAVGNALWRVAQMGGRGGLVIEPWQFAVEPGGQAVPVLRFTGEV